MGWIFPEIWDELDTREKLEAYLATPDDAAPEQQA